MLNIWATYLHHRDLLSMQHNIHKIFIKNRFIDKILLNFLIFVGTDRLSRLFMGDYMYLKFLCINMLLLGCAIFAGSSVSKPPREKKSRKSLIQAISVKTKKNLRNTIILNGLISPRRCNKEPEKSTNTLDEVKKNLDKEKVRKITETWKDPKMQEFFLNALKVETKQ
jgi:hypothetical protein